MNEKNGRARHVATCRKKTPRSFKYRMIDVLVLDAALFDIQLFWGQGRTNTDQEHGNCKEVMI